MRDKKEQKKQQENEFPVELSNHCLTFTSHELFWKELETIVEDGAEMADE
ncbi:hypothetical protein ACLM5H_09585 [Fredinandcohnia humi]